MEEYLLSYAKSHGLDVKKIKQEADDTAKCLEPDSPKSYEEIYLQCIALQILNPYFDPDDYVWRESYRGLLYAHFQIYEFVDFEIALDQFCKIVTKPDNMNKYEFIWKTIQRVD